MCGFMSRVRSAFLVVFVSLSFSSTTLAASSVAMSKVEKENEELVRAFIASLGQKDMSKVASFLAEDFSFQSAMNNKRQYGAKTFTDWWYSMIKHGTKLEPKIVRIDTIGNIVILETQYLYQDAQGQHTFKGSRFVNIKNGEISEFQEYKLPE